MPHRRLYRHCGSTADGDGMASVNVVGDEAPALLRDMILHKPVRVSCWYVLGGGGSTGLRWKLLNYPIVVWKLKKRLHVETSHLPAEKKRREGENE